MQRGQPAREAGQDRGEYRGADFLRLQKRQQPHQLGRQALRAGTILFTTIPFKKVSNSVVALTVKQAVMDIPSS